ncbi:glycosyltransferase [Candidatus Pelagibacter sp.]|nr:glycosyltransferase [Candidatus Pelagibacter sp.]
MKIKILIPLYNDWQSLLKLLENINHHVSDINHIISIVVVNDGSTEKAPNSFLSYSKINSIKIINLKENIGHARSIATGLKFIMENDNFDYVIPMDSDGEDRPVEIKDLIKKIAPQSDLPIVCERVKRSEGFFFKFCYFLHKLVTFIFTGRSIKFGNFTCLPKEIVKSMINEKATWSSFSGALSKISKLKIGISSERGTRYFGPSKMSFKNLIIHSLAIIAVFKVNVLIRSIFFFFIYLFLIYEKISVITLIPILLIIIFNLLVILISKRENLESYRNSNQNIFDVKVIK